ncbi:hypothetical protein LEP1GSC125_2208 [Leptospira mayottensis 200901122]|uniref:Uncharacterized protein n=1 Tax=Leptospira mayottensis 200901122 TaxID=1193010 RepID=A0AA87MS72_9LEPT|nr:hypothetical protein LEP1GSC125_2208 [Leptospira mayottensis 200901122]
MYYPQFFDEKIPCPVKSIRNIQKEQDSNFLKRDFFEYLDSKFSIFKM